MADTTKILDSMSSKKPADLSGKNQSQASQIAPGVDKLVDKMVTHTEAMIVTLYHKKLASNLANPDSAIIKKLNDITANLVTSELENLIGDNLDNFLPEGKN